MSTRLPVREATEHAPNARRDRGADGERQRSDLQAQAGRAVPDRGGQREGVVGGHFADP